MRASHAIVLPIAIAMSLVAGSSSPSGQTPDTTTIVPDKAFTSGIEGPAVDRDGRVYIVNFERQGTIGVVAPDGKAGLFVALPEGSIANGIRFGPPAAVDTAAAGAWSGPLVMYVADYTKHNVLQIDPKTKVVTVFAHEPTMNQPNDVAIAADGRLFASDPNWKAGTGQIWRIDRDGRATRLEADMGTTNGIEVSPDGRKLYVNESVQRNVWVYDLSPAGDVSGKRLLIKFDDFGMDGMRADVDGNLYITRHGKGTVAKVSPDGRLLKEIRTQGTKPSNIAFGGPDGRTAYVTLQDRGAVETFRAESPGREWAMLQKK
jgi:sugar lactone lactonase YvrE